MYKYFIILFLLITTACGNSNQTNNGTKTASEKSKNSSSSTTKKFVEKVIVKGIGNTMADMAFDKKVIKVKRGTIVELTLINEATESSMIHNLVITKKGKADAIGMDAISLKAKNYVPDSPDVIAATDLANPGETVTLRFDAPAPGTYEFLCTFPGHHQKMRGVFFVQ